MIRFLYILRDITAEVSFLPNWNMVTISTEKTREIDRQTDK